MAETFDVVATRDIPAPLDSAWKSWTDEDYVRKWWGPNGFTCPVAEMDVRVGGRSLVCMSAPDWRFPALYSTWAYTLVDAPRPSRVRARYVGCRGQISMPALSRPPFTTSSLSNRSPGW